MSTPFLARDFIASVAVWHGITFEDIMSRKRDAKTYAARRDVIVHLSDRNWSASRIGRLIGRNHSTVGHALGGAR